MIVFFIIILIIIAAISNAVMDTIYFNFENSIFSNFKNQNWYNPMISWKNKYKGKDPNNGPAFWGSTTFFVFLTDAWHFFQMIMLSSISIAIILGLNYAYFSKFAIFHIIIIDIAIFFAIKIIYGGIFELFWNNLFIKKLNKKK
jgi:hypothetical protein